MIKIFSSKRTSSLALAIALATGSAVVATAVIPAEASAQRKRDKDKKDEQKPQYSKEFIAAYQPLNEQLTAEGASLAALQPQIDALLPLAQSPDEQNAAGGLVYNAGATFQNEDLQLKGLELMLSSGKVAPENVGRFNFIAYQLANSKGNFATARQYLGAAIKNNFTTETITRSDLEIAMAENYFADAQYKDGLSYLTQAINDRKAEGQTVEEQWYRRGVTVAYQNEVVPEVYDILTMWLSEYPSSAGWADAINITRNLNTFASPEMLDLFRLSRRVDALRTAQDYDYYVETADARRLPKEVSDVIKEGIAAGVVSSTSSYTAEALETANSRIAADRADLPDLERDADAPGAELRLVTAAGSTFLSYGQYDKAVRFYERALTMPGVETDEVLTRLGMAQVGMGDFAAARETLGKVSGARMSIAKLWMTYAEQQEGNQVTSAAMATS